MTNATIPRLASEVSVSLMGVGSYLPEHRVSNEEILAVPPSRPPRRPAPRTRVGGQAPGHL